MTMSDEVRKGKTSLSLLDVTELARNLADRVDEGGNREPGLLELLSMIQADCRPHGIAPDKLVMSTGIVAVTSRLIIRCPAGSRIVVFDYSLGKTAAGSASFRDQDGVALMSVLSNSTAVSVSRSCPRGLYLPPGKSMYLSCTVGSSWEVDVSYTIIPSVI